MNRNRSDSFKVQPVSPGYARGFVKSLYLLGIGVISGAVLVLLMQGTGSSGTSKLGSGLKNLLESQVDRPPIVEKKEESLKLPEPSKILDEEFTFWDLLPGLEQVIPDDPADSDAVNAVDDSYVYFLQIASFAKEEDADALRARLALAGYETHTQRVELEQAGIRYRVRTATFESRRELKNLKQELQEQGVSPLTVRLDAS